MFMHGLSIACFFITPTLLYIWRNDTIRYDDTSHPQLHGFTSSSVPHHPIIQHHSASNANILVNVVFSSILNYPASTASVVIDIVFSSTVFHSHYQQLVLMLRIDLLDLLVLLLYFWILASIPIRLTCYTIFFLGILSVHRTTFWVFVLISSGLTRPRIVQ